MHRLDTGSLKFKFLSIVRLNFDCGSEVKTWEEMTFINIGFHSIIVKPLKYPDQSRFYSYLYVISNIASTIRCVVISRRSNIYISDNLKEVTWKNVNKYWSENRSLWYTIFDKIIFSKRVVYFGSLVSFSQITMYKF